MIPDKLYTILKWCCLILLPAVNVLFGSLSAIWNWPPYAEQIMLTISAVSTFIGALIGVSTARYNAKLKKENEG